MDMRVIPQKEMHKDIANTLDTNNNIILDTPIVLGMPVLFYNGTVNTFALIHLSNYLGALNRKQDMSHETAHAKFAIDRYFSAIQMIIGAGAIITEDVYLELYRWMKHNREFYKVQKDYVQGTQQSGDLKPINSDCIHIYSKYTQNITSKLIMQ